MLHDELAEELFFSKEAADYLGISVQRLNKLVHDGKLKPLKKSASGTLFHRKELEQRKKELLIFDSPTKEGDRGMFQINNRTKQEALNFAVLMNLLGCSENKLEPDFSALGKTIDVSKPMTNAELLNFYCEKFNISADKIKDEYYNATQAFSRLRSTDEIIKRGSSDYPPLLMKTEQAPRFLYIRGNKSLLYETRTVALVGSRNASEKAKENTRRIAEALGKNGVTVVSGLAKGIDATAHLTALKNNYNTIAVIGTNLNQYYPRENTEIQMEIEKKGLIVSQFPPSLKTQRWFFPVRNGVMSGLSLATVIMEAGETSGALKQADCALKQGRQLLIPEKALQMESITWPSKYVKKGAVVVKSPTEVLQALAENNVFRPSQSMDAMQQSIDSYLYEKKKANQQNYELEWADSAIAGE